MLVSDGSPIRHISLRWSMSVSTKTCWSQIGLQSGMSVSDGACWSPMGQFGIQWRSSRSQNRNYGLPRFPLLKWRVFCWQRSLSVYFSVQVTWFRNSGKIFETDRVLMTEKPGRWTIKIINIRNHDTLTIKFSAPDPSKL